MRKFLLLLTLAVSLIAMATEYPGHPGYGGRYFFCNANGDWIEPPTNPDTYYLYCFEYDPPTQSAVIVGSNVLGNQIDGGVILPCFINITHDSDVPDFTARVIGIASSVTSHPETVSAIVLPDYLEFITEPLELPNITTITLPPTVQYIPSDLTYGCNNLKELILQDADVTLNIEGISIEGNSYVGVFAYAPIENAYIGKNIVSGIPPFQNGTTLTSLTLSGNVTEMRNEMFRDQSALTTVTMKEGVGYIADKAFFNCTKLQGINIPASAQYIGKDAFSNDSMMTAVTLNEGLRFIDGNAFYYCYNVKELYLPATLDSIYSDAFTFMYNVNKVTIADSDRPLRFFGNRYWGNGAFDSFKSYTAYQGRNVTNDNYAFPPFQSSGVNGSLTVLTIGDQVTELPENAFIKNFELKTVTIGSSLAAIPKQAFADCIALTGIDIPGNVKSIGEKAFNNDSLMTTATLHEGLQFIDGNAFYNCYNVKELYLPATLDSIYSDAFTFMYNVNKVTIADSDRPLRFFGNRYWQNGAFDSFKSYTAYQGRNVTNDNSALPPFQSGGTNGSLTALTIGDQVTEIPENAFIKNIELKTVNIGTGLVSIPKQAFADCITLTGIDITGNVKSIGEKAFNNDSLMTTATLHEGLQFIDRNAFYNCYNVKELYLPATLDSIYSDAFTFMYNVNKVTIADSDRSLKFFGNRYWGNGAFDSFKSYTAYQGRNVKNDDKAFPPFQSSGKNGSLTALTIGDRVTELTENAFIKNIELKTVTIGTGLAAIPKQAFADCIALTGIDIPGNVKSIGVKAFNNDSLMTAATLHEGLQFINEDAFYNCSKVKELYLPATLDSIYSNAFNFMYDVKKVTIADSDRPLRFFGNRYWGDGACKEMSLDSAYVGRDLVVDNRALSPFYNHKTLNKVTIGEKVTTIIDNQFYNCKQLALITSNAVEPPICANTAFRSLEPKDITLIVPKDSKNKYKSAPIWELFFDEEVTPGDVNGDNSVNAGDVGSLYKRILAGEYDSACDVNNDGYVNAGDIGAVYKIILGQE